MRAKGIEPIRLTAPDPKSGLSTNFNTPATLFIRNAKVRNLFLLAKFNAAPILHSVMRNIAQAVLCCGIDKHRHILSVETADK